MANPSVWAKTVLFLTFDENGGFFDHVPPTTAPPGTPGEYVTAAAAPDPSSIGNPAISGPIGLGFRVPMLRNFFPSAVAALWQRIFLITLRFCDFSRRV